MRHFPALLLLLLALGNTAQSDGATLRVGVPFEPGCTNTSLASAVAEAAANDDSTNTIRLGNIATYPSIRVALSGTKRLNIEGGYDNCIDSIADPNQPAVLNAQVGDAAFEVNVSGGPGLFLRNVIIQGGDNATGGGIEVRSGNVTLEGVQVRNNRARYGGGIYLDGLGAAVPVRLQIGLNDAPSYVFDNTASASSSADGRGGGVHCGNGATISFIAGGVYSNNARLGGGISADTGCTLQFNGFQPAVTPGIRNNIATSNGGGIYADQANIASNGATHILIDGNRAMSGAALFAAGATEADLRYAWIKGNRADPSNAVVTVIDGSVLNLRGGPLFVRCANAEYCSQLHGHPDNMNAISLVNGGSVLLERVHVTGFHSSGPLIESINSNVTMSNALITDNQASVAVLRLSGAAAASVNFSTLMNNTTPAAFTSGTSTTGTVQLDGSIVFASGLLGAPGNTLAFSSGACPAVVAENAHADGVGRPVLSPGLNSAYVPGELSEAADNCASAISVETDLESNPRTVDLPIGDLIGPRDVGAIERQLTLPAQIFINSFE